MLPTVLGLLFMIMAVLTAALAKDWTIVYHYAGVFGLLCWAIAAILAITAIRPNTVAMTTVDGQLGRKSRFRWAFFVFLVAAPNLSVSLIVYLVLHV